MNGQIIEENKRYIIQNDEIESLEFYQQIQINRSKNSRK